ncbi:MAG: tRNA (adenosine(37)-N6)-threonylcarbamoyltransferase complex dimerization subunit type 1 TsaB [Luteolibacter sp.]
MPSVLIIETSTEAASIAFVIGQEIVGEKSFISDRRHNALLFEPLSELLNQHGSGNFEAILVGGGPGSYSGTRVGIATAQGAALVAGCKAVSIPSILATHEAVSGKPCLAVGDARRGSYWHCRIEGGKLLEDPQLTDGIGLDSAIASAESAGSSVFCMEPVKGKSITLSRPSATGLWQAWQTADANTRSQWAAKVPQPIYLKPPHVTPSKKKVFG